MNSNRKHPNVFPQTDIQDITYPTGTGEGVAAGAGAVAGAGAGAGVVTAAGL